MSIPLRGQREVFRRLEMQQDARRQRQYQQQELLGLEPQRPSLDDYRNAFFTETGHGRMTPGRHLDLDFTENHGRLMNGSGYGFNMDSEGVHLSPARNIRGVRSRFMWIDEYVGRPNNQENRRAIASRIEYNMLSYICLSMREATRNNTRYNLNDLHHGFNPCAEFVMDSHRPIYFDIRNLVSGGRRLDWHQGYVTEPYVDRRTKKIIFGPLKAYLSELLETEMDKYLGRTRVERIASKLSKNKAGNKPLATLLLKRKEE